MRIARPAFVEVDLAALTGNLRTVRRLVGPDVKVYAVCKGDAYGAGIVEAARCALAAGADALATTDPEDVATLRGSGIKAPVLLYPFSHPAMAGELAKLGAIVTLHDLPGIEAFASLGRPLEAYLKLDCGFGRLGLVKEEWEEGFRKLRSAANIRLVGLYTHLGHTESAHLVEPQVTAFKQASAMAEAAGFSGLERMVASSRVVVGYPQLRLNAVNPGRMLYGLLEEPWTEMIQVQPVLKAVKSSVIQVKTLPAGAVIGYADPHPLPQARRLAVVPIGFANGFPRRARRTPEVLIRGRRVPMLGLRSTEHTMVDVSGLDEVNPGDEAVLLGRQGEEEITAQELSDVFGLPMIELLPRLGRSSPRVYLR